MALVVHCKKAEYDVYIGRPSKWGNPFQMKRNDYRERDRVILAYREWIKDQPELIGALHELKGKTLGCWCAPMPCHGDVLVELSKEANACLKDEAVQIAGKMFECRVIGG